MGYGIYYYNFCERSTDSEIKLWDVNTGRCLKTYHGHRNDKNFVGLAVKGSHIVCGTLYCKIC